MRHNSIWLGQNRRVLPQSHGTRPCATDTDRKSRRCPRRTVLHHKRSRRRHTHRPRQGIRNSRCCSSCGSRKRSDRPAPRRHRRTGHRSDRQAQHPESDLHFPRPHRISRSLSGKHRRYRLERPDTRQSFNGTLFRKNTRGSGNRPHTYKRRISLNHQRAYRGETIAIRSIAPSRFRHTHTPYSRPCTQSACRRRRTSRKRRKRNNNTGDCRSPREKNSCFRPIRRRRLFRQRKLQQIRRHTGNVPRSGPRSFQDHRNGRRRQLYRRAAIRAHIARPRHRLRHSRTRPGIARIDALRHICRHRHIP